MEAISLEQREADLRVAQDELDVITERWLEARAGNRMTPKLESELDEALRVWRAAESRRVKTMKRLSKVAG